MIKIRRKDCGKKHVLLACLLAAAVAAGPGFAGNVRAREDVLLDGETEIATESAQILAEDETSPAPAEGTMEKADPAEETTEKTAPAEGITEKADSSEEITEKADLMEGEEGREVVTNGLTFASDYKEVYEALKKAEGYYPPYLMGGDVLDYAVEETSTAVNADSGANAASAAGKAVSSERAAEDFSTTNLRDEGVDEADIVKTDGKYIYILKESRYLVIVEALGEDSTHVSTTDLTGTDPDAYSTTITARDMYVDADTLVVIFDRSDRLTGEEQWTYAYKNTTQTSTYSIADPEKPVLLGSVSQDGNYSQSRKTGDKVYVYSTRYIDTWYREYEELSKEIVPWVNNEAVEPGRICIPEYVTDSAYLIAASVSTKEPERVIDSKVLVSGAENIYVTTGSLYVMNQSYQTSQGRTEIVKFSCEDGKIVGRAAARVKGSINDTFSIDEYNGNLRVLTTYMGSDTGALLEALSDLLGLGYYADDHWVRHNALYILDENLNRRAKLGDIAENEEIRSARYFGDMVYFVTFRNTDPLFGADLSDPDHPRITGELKITGFSAYLHPYGEGKLLGIGYEADEFTGSSTGLKLSMFDITDPTDIQEANRYVLEGITWCPAIEDYKAILADGQKNLIGFFFDNRYMVFSYDEEQGFERVLLYDFYEDMLGGTVSYETMRGLYIGDELYLAGENFVVGFDMEGEEGFEKNLVLKIE